MNTVESAIFQHFAVLKVIYTWANIQCSVSIHDCKGRPHLFLILKKELRQVTSRWHILCQIPYTMMRHSSYIALHLWKVLKTSLQERHVENKVRGQVITQGYREQNRSLTSRFFLTILKLYWHNKTKVNGTANPCMPHISDN